MPDPVPPTGPGALSFQREPVWYIAAGQGIIQAVILLLTSFNVPITSAQQAAITGVALAVGAAWARSKTFAPVNAAGQPVVAIPDRRAAERPDDNFAGSLDRVAPEHKSDEQLLADYKERQKRFSDLPPPIKANK